MQAAYAARTRTDLQCLFVDLPEPAPFRVTTTPATAPVQPGPRRMPLFIPVIPLLLVALIVASIVTRLPLFPLFFVWLFFGGLGRRAWRGPRGYAGHRSW